MLKNAIEIEPEHAEAYVQLGMLMREERRYPEAEELLRKAIEVEPENEEAYIELAYSYKKIVFYDQAEEMLKKAIEIEPEDEKAYIELGILKREQRLYPEAEEMFRKAIEIEPENERAYAEMAWSYMHRGLLDEPEEILKKGIEVNPDNHELYINLGMLYTELLLEYDKSEEMLKKAIEMVPDNIEAYIQLGMCYISQKKYDKAEAAFREAMRVEPEANHDNTYRLLSRCYMELGNNKLAEYFLKKTNVSSSGYYDFIITHNYRKLNGIVAKRGVKLVCVQYPMRSVKQLRKLFDSTEGIIFVDNEKIFKEALEKASYDEYFIDSFGGDFGHCTKKGNELIAENIADTILRYGFKK